ncbi:MT-A70 family methyltransferase (plasmid) [Phyllobacterium sp. A18/5-2]|nr:MT-A70 family methyltransferase [Phyllobacterium sp. A18/5-2]
MLPQQLTTIKAWGFEYCTEGVWVKMSKSKVSFGTGYGLRGSHEPFIIAKRAEPKLTKSTRSVIHGKAREHSRKPEEAYREAERLMPSACRIDLFSRGRIMVTSPPASFLGLLSHFDALPPHAGIKSMTRMIATALLVFCVPSVVSALAQVQTSPFLTVNFFSF